MRFAVCVSDFARGWFAFPHQFLVSKEEVAGILRLSQNQVDQLVSTGLLPPPEHDEDEQAPEMWDLKDLKRVAKTVGSPRELQRRLTEAS